MRVHIGIRADAMIVGIRIAYGGAAQNICNPYAGRRFLPSKSYYLRAIRVRAALKPVL
jgi:hypothetical protein